MSWCFLTFNWVEIIEKFFLEGIELEKRKFSTDPDFRTGWLFRGESWFSPNKDRLAPPSDFKTLNDYDIWNQHPKAVL